MKNTLYPHAAVSIVAACLFFAVVDECAGSKWTPLYIGADNRYYDEEDFYENGWNVCGLRLGLGSPANPKMYGMSVSFWMDGGYSKEISATNTMMRCIDDSFGGIKIGLAGAHAAGSGWGFLIGGLGTEVGGTLVGFEFGGVLSEASFMNGFQFGGLIAESQYYMRGLQFGSLYSVAGTDDPFAETEQDKSIPVEDIPASGGFQLAGITAYSRGSFRGFQLGGLVANTGNASGGFQLGGVYAGCEGSFHGFQLGGITYSREMRGVQIGAINVAGNLKGFQIGAINVSGTTKGDDQPLFFFPGIACRF